MIDCTVKSIHGASVAAKGKGIHLQVILSGSYFSRKKVEALTAIPQIHARITATTPCFGFTERYVFGLTTAIQRSIVNDTQVNMEIYPKMKQNPPDQIVRQNISAAVSLYAGVGGK